MTSAVRRGRTARRAARREHKLEFLPELDRGVPYVDLIQPEQVQRLPDESMRLLEDRGIEFRDDEAATIDDFDNFAKLAFMEPAMQMTGGVLCEPMDVAVPHRPTSRWCAASSNTAINRSWVL